MKKLSIFVCLLCLFVAVPALADPYGTVDVTYQGYDPKWNVTLNTYQDTYDPVSYYTVSGMVTLDLLNVSSVNPSWEPYLTGTVEAFCLDLGDYSANVGVKVNYDVASLDSTPDPWAGPMGETRARYLAQLLDKYWNSDLDTDIEKAALQLAIWEVVDESRLTQDDPMTVGLNVKIGMFTVDETVATTDLLNLANVMLDSITTGGSDYSSYVGLTNDYYVPATGTGKYQDWVVKVPVPAAVWLGMIGLGAAGLKLRRFA